MDFRVLALQGPLSMEPGTQLGSRGERVSLAELGTEFRVWPVQVL